MSREGAPHHGTMTAEALGRAVIGWSYLGAGVASLFALGAHAYGMDRWAWIVAIGSGGGHLALPTIVWIAVGLGILHGRRSAVIFSVLAFPCLALFAAFVKPDLPVAPWWWLARVPFQAVQHAVMARPLAVPPSASAADWPLWSLHTAVLVLTLLPWFSDIRARARATRRRNRRRRTLSLPADVLSLYSQNPFQVLGLQPAATTTRSIVKRRDEMKVLAEAGMDAGESLGDLERVGSLGTDDAPTEVVRAVARLQNEPDRLREALLWYRLEDESEDVRDALRRGEPESAARIWKERRANGSSPGARATALHNLAVATHVRALEEEEARATPKGLGNRERWEEALSLWSAVVGDDECWAYLRDRRARASDPRVDDRFMSGLRDELASRVLTVNLDLADAGARQGFTAYAKAHVRLVEEAPFADACKTAVLDAFFASGVERAREILKPLVLHQNGELLDAGGLRSLAQDYKGVREGLARLGGESRLAGMAEESVSTARKRLNEKVSTAVTRFIDLDRALFRGNAHLVEQWNVHMNEYNRLPYPLDQRPKAMLRAIHTAMGERRSEVGPVSEAAREVRQIADEAKAALRVLHDLAADASTKLREQLTKQMTDAEESALFVDRELEKTKAHLSRNLSGMGQCLS